MTPRKRILCVEDHPDTTELIAVLLQDCKVISAQTKADALRQAAAGQFDLYLLDYQLPDGLGLEICLFIRTFDPKTPILFYTGTDLLTEPQVRTLGAQALIKKGETFSNDLRAAISRFL